MVSKLRVGIGYDIHRLVINRKLKLGGVNVPFDLGLEGHSDGDVLIHAIIDALLGPTGSGDIGMFFPPGDERFANVDSGVLLSEVSDRLKKAGYRIINIDAVIVCERPKLAQYYSHMRANLGTIISIEAGQINVKSKTAEGLGTVGRGEAIAAQAVALTELVD